MFGNGLTKLNNSSSVQGVIMSMKNSFLHWLDSASMRFFIQKYDGYCRELRASASQLSAESSAFMEPEYPVGLLYWIGGNQIESAVECHVIEACNDIGLLTEETVWMIL